MYRIYDLQLNDYFSSGEVFKTKADIISRLANYHDIDYIGVKSDDSEYYDIFEFLDTLKNDTERLNWLLDYGQWEIQKVTYKELTSACENCKEFDICETTGKVCKKFKINYSI